jgi:hypothetical protein
LVGCKLKLFSTKFMPNSFTIHIQLIHRCLRIPNHSHLSCSQLVPSSFITNLQIAKNLASDDMCQCHLIDPYQCHSRCAYFGSLGNMTAKGAFTFVNFACDFALSSHVLLKKFITKCASLVRNHTQNCANVNAP